MYIGASEYEILSVDDERVMLYDYDMPLFNKEFSRTEFDRKVRENPMNEHLIVKEEPAEERNEAEEVQTNMGSMPIEDYREIVASQSGFDRESNLCVDKIGVFNAEEAGISLHQCLLRTDEAKH